MPVKTDHEPQVPVAPESELGEAMLVLTKPQRAFVTAMLLFGGVDQNRAALAAGYGGNERSASVIACRMMRNPRIIAAMREEADRRLQSGALLASSVLTEIAMDARHKDRFKAAVELLNRSGLMVETRQRITIEDNRDTNDLKREVAKMLSKLYKDQPLLPALPKPIDAQFEEIDPNDISDIMCDV
jgi:phage terminase small subunit